MLWPTALAVTGGIVAPQTEERTFAGTLAIALSVPTIDSAKAEAPGELVTPHSGSLLCHHPNYHLPQAALLLPSMLLMFPMTVLFIAIG